MQPTFSVEAQCGKCKCAVFETTDDSADDPIFVCTNCSKHIGPKSSIKAALLGQAHTPLGALIVPKDNSAR